MNNHRQHWQPDDFELEEEFHLTQAQVQQQIPEAPRVPKRLDRLVKKYAQAQVSNQLVKSFIFSPAIQLGLAALLMGAIGLGFVLSLEPQTPQLSLKTEFVTTDWQPDSAIHNNIKNSDASWLLVQFQVDAFGRASQIKVIETCIRSKASTCDKAHIYDQMVRQHILSATYPIQGSQRRLVWVEP